MSQRQRPGPLPKIKREVADRMDAMGSPVATIAKVLGEEPARIRHYLDGRKPLSAAAMDGKPNMEAVRAARGGRAPRTSDASGHRSQSIREDAETAVAALPSDTRTLTGRVFGDPLPGRSALDQRREGRA